MNEMVAEEKKTEQEMQTALVALHAGDMPMVQQGLVSWFDWKVASLQKEADEYQENYEHAKKMKWRSSAIKRALTSTKKRISYYEKCKAAVEAGYVITPPFPGMEVFAVRTKKKNPRANGWESNTKWGDHEQKSEGLPCGSGEYKSSLPVVNRGSDPIKAEDGKIAKYNHWSLPVEFQDVEFPVVMVNPQVTEATSRAMSEKIFDEIGILPATFKGRDPIVMGRIKDPRQNRDGLYFFIAWWLDPETL